MGLFDGAGEHGCCVDAQDLGVGRLEERVVDEFGSVEGAVRLVGCGESVFGALAEVCVANDFEEKPEGGGDPVGSEAVACQDLCSKLDGKDDLRPHGG